MKPIIRQKPAETKSKIMLQVDENLLKRYKKVKKDIRALADAECGIDERVESYLERCVAQAEKELESYNRDKAGETAKGDLAVSDA